jgi:hypothetical protein
MVLYLDQLKMRYKQANKKVKSIILNEFCDASGYHRQHAIRLLTLLSKKQGASTLSERRGRKKAYLSDLVLPPLNQIWLGPTRCVVSV